MTSFFVGYWRMPLFLMSIAISPKTINMLAPCTGTLWSGEPSVYPQAAQVLKIASKTSLKWYFFESSRRYADTRKQESTATKKCISWLHSSSMVLFYLFYNHFLLYYRSIKKLLRNVKPFYCYDLCSLHFLKVFVYRVLFRIFGKIFMFRLFS